MCTPNNESNTMLAFNKLKNSLARLPYLSKDIEEGRAVKSELEESLDVLLNSFNDQLAIASNAINQLCAVGSDQSLSSTERNQLINKIINDLDYQNRLMT